MATGAALALPEPSGFRWLTPTAGSVLFAQLAPRSEAIVTINNELDAATKVEAGFIVAGLGACGAGRATAASEQNAPEISAKTRF